MKDITIIRMEPGVFGVQVEEANGVASSHRVAIDAELAEELGGPELDHEVLVRETFGFLLDREPTTAIDAEFSIRDVDRAFADYREEMVRRMSGRGGMRVQ